MVEDPSVTVKCRTPIEALFYRKTKLFKMSLAASKPKGPNRKTKLDNNATIERIWV
jgi:hypothetical protein